MSNTRMNTRAHNTMTHFNATPMASMRAAFLRGATDIGQGDFAMHGMMEPLAYPGVCNVDGDDDDAGGEGTGKTEPAKTHSKEDVERIVAKRLAAQAKENAALTKKLADAEKRATDIEERMADLESKGKGDGVPDARELARAEKRIKQLEDQLKNTEAEKERAALEANEAKTGLNRHRISSTVQNALAAAKAHAKGLPDATEMMLSRCSPEYDADTGELTLTVDGVPFTNVNEAAKRFLETRPYFAEGVGGGAGLIRPNGSGGGRVSPEQLKGMSSDELLLSGLNTPAKPTV